MITQRKWDIVDDIVAYEPMADVGKARRSRARIAKVTSAIFSVVLTSGIVLATGQRTLQLVSYGTSDAVKLSESLRFTRPRGYDSRIVAAAQDVDTRIGMSTRRLGELHGRLFIQDTSVHEELTDDYDFL